MLHRTVYICDWLPPDFGAVGQYSLQFARERAIGGQHVVLVGLSSRRESIERQPLGSGLLEVIRIRARTYDRSNFTTRLLWTIQTNCRLLRHAWSQIKSADEILFTGSPPFLLHFLAPLNLLLRKRLVYRITDFHPECLMAERQHVPSWLRAIYKLTLFWRRRVHHFEVLGEDQGRRLREIGIPRSRFELKRDPSPIRITPHTKPLPIPPELQGYVILLYSGNFGVAHDHETFLNGYRLHHQTGPGRVALWLNAVGTKADLVEQSIRRLGLPIHRSRPVTLETLPRLLVTADAHLITLRDPFVGFVLPSKVYACIQSGRDVLYVGSERSDIDLLCRESLAPSAYQRIPVGDLVGVARALEILAERPTRAAAPHACSSTGPTFSHLVHTSSNILQTHFDIGTPK